MEQQELNAMNGRSEPAFAWREQVQRRVRGLLAEHGLTARQWTLEEWRQAKNVRRQLLRQAMTEASSAFMRPGSLPAAPRILRETSFDGFRVQNIVIESLPGRLVGLNLFLPADKEPFVPVLCPCGHGPKWQDDHQIAPQVLAQNGFAAALFDAPMFGEQSRNNDHFLQGAQMQMVGQWSGFFFLTDPVCVANYLATREDVTLRHGLGVTGVSGGGVIAQLLAQIDDRVRAIVPVCAVSALAGYILDGFYTGCPEDYLIGQLRLGMDLDDWLCMAAPVPCLVIGGMRDPAITPETIETSVEKARRFYELEGAVGNLALFFDDCPHKYTVPMAVEAAGWFRRRLLNDSEAVNRRAVDLLPREQLDCGTGATTEGMFDSIRREVRRLQDGRRSDTSDSALLEVLAIELPSSPGHCETVPRATKWGKEGLSRKRVALSGDISLPVLQLERPVPESGTIVGFSDGDKFQLLKRLAQVSGVRRIVAADLRGFGELTPAPSDYDTNSWCSIDCALSDLLLACGETAIGQQTRDAWRTLDAVARDSAVSGELMVMGSGEAALPALFAGLLHPRVTRIVLDSFPCSFAMLATAERIRWKRYQYLPGVLKRFDLPELLASRREKKFLVVNPCDGLKRPLDEIAALALYDRDAGNTAVHVAFGSADLAAAIRQWIETPVPAAEPLDPTPAIRGGRPVRVRPFPCKLLGADLTGLGELYQVQESLATKTLFRHYGIGKPVMAKTFEQKMRDRFGARFALGLTSGSAALFCAMAGLNIGPGDEVILPAFSWYSCFNAILRFGAMPVFCGIDRTMNLDPSDFERRITPRTKAVIVVHYQGGPARMDEIMAIARRTGVKVVEDCAQAIGASYRGHLLGTIGDVATFSFQGNKILTAGEGGLIATGDALVFERAVRFHDLGHFRPVFAGQVGQDAKVPQFAGEQFRMSELTAAVMNAQLDRLDWIVSRCRRRWRMVKELVQREVPEIMFRDSPCADGDAGITLFVDRGTAAAGKGFLDALAAEGIAVGPSSGMSNLLREEYVQARRTVHPALPPLASAGEKYAAELLAATEQMVQRMTPIAIGPRYSEQDARDIAAAIVKLARAL
ncbi:MAG: UDP-4-amino-4-deoxy-L-arabinose--oxoglutarate aminotransferase [Verrucomicrobiae bacterium]|nr:UDP-4-amino-4-deoxy-L-arabinose--oxoglutarate aminotransferase [Verrucomicrobiae bacterium]